MSPPKTDREPVVSEGSYAIVAATNEEPAAFWLVTDDGEAFPLERSGLDDAVTALTRLQKRVQDAETAGEDEPRTTEFTCHECGKTWQHPGDDEHATCPNCETEVPEKGIGP